MGNKLKVSTETLDKDIAQFNQLIANLQTYISDMREDLRELGTMWSGPSHDTYEAQFTSDCDLAQELVGKLKKFSQELEKASGEYKKCSSRVDDYINRINL